MPDLTAEQIAKLAPDHPIFTVMERLEKIEQTLLANDPEIRTHLRVIHQQMRDYDDLPHLLKPEEIGILMKGMQKNASMSLAVEVTKSKSGGKSKKVGYDDIV